MATELVIKAWCDVCLAAGEDTPGQTLTVNVSGDGSAPPFDVEACPEHAAPFLTALAGLSAYGRPVGKGVPKTPAASSNRRPRADEAPGRQTCPDCGRAYATTGILRSHLRNQHGKSLADVGLEAATHVCPDCGGKFANGQGLASHSRAAHRPPARRRKESA